MTLKTTFRYILLLLMTLNTLHASFMDRFGLNLASIAAVTSPFLVGKSLCAWYQYQQAREELENRIPGLSEALEVFEKYAQEEEKKLGPDWQVFVKTPQAYEHMLGKNSFECRLLKKYLFKEKFFLSSSFLCAFAWIVSWKFLAKENFRPVYYSI